MPSDTMKLTDALERRLLEDELAGRSVRGDGDLARKLVMSLLRATGAAIGAIQMLRETARDNRVVYCEG